MFCSPSDLYWLGAPGGITTPSAKTWLDALGTQADALPPGHLGRGRGNPLGPTRGHATTTPRRGWDALCPNAYACVPGPALSNRGAV